MKKNILLISLTCLFILLLTATAYVSFSGNIDTQEVTVNSITPIYDETSGVIVTQDKVTFNDKNQVVDYKVVIENTQEYDVKINNISLTTPTEEFLSFEVENLNKDDIVEANSTKEITISFETMGIEGWGRNFSDELTANISFEKVSKQEEVVPPKEETPKEEDKPTQEETPKEDETSKPIPQPEAPVKDNKELIKNVKKIEEVAVTTNTIELPKEIKVSVGEKIAVWIYSEPIFLGYFDVVVENGIKKIEGLEEALSKTEIKAGEHNIVLVSNKETIGYVPVSINENKELITEDNKRDEAIENPYTSDNGLLIVLIAATTITGVAIVVVSKNKVTKYIVFAIVLGSTLIPTKAEDSIELPITFNVNFESQNVMKPAYTLNAEGKNSYHDYWAYNEQLKNFYIQTEIKEIKDVAHQFDVTESGNGRVKAYLVKREDLTCYAQDDANVKIDCYDAYLQADGIIYPNENMAYYFDAMVNLEKIDDLSKFDTSNVTIMKALFQRTGYYSSDFSVDVSSFITDNVTDMAGMFSNIGYNSTKIELDVSNFDTSNVTVMNAMFQNTGYNNPNFVLDVSNFDTSKVTNMRNMFYFTGYNSKKLELDVSNFDTKNVIDMKAMFNYAGFSNPNFKLDVSGFDTSNVTEMKYMFAGTGENSQVFSIDLSNFDTSKVNNISYILSYAGYHSTKLKTSITIKNPNTTTYDHMFREVATKPGSQIKVNYTAETEELVKKMIATKSANSNVILGNLIVDVDNLSTGDEIHISGEKFNVISQTDDTVTMLAQYNLGPDYRQSTTVNGVKFSDTPGWEYTPGPKEIDIQTWSTNPKTYVNNYVDYLKTELGDDSVTGNLITLKELQTLGCTINEVYSYSTALTCTNSSYKSWLINNQSWWTRSAHSLNMTVLWFIGSDGLLYNFDFIASHGVRPTITISKEALRNYK